MNPIQAMREDADKEREGLMRVSPDGDESPAPEKKQNPNFEPAFEEEPQKEKQFNDYSDKFWENKFQEMSKAFNPEPEKEEENSEEDEEKPNPEPEKGETIESLKALLEEKENKLHLFDETIKFIRENPKQFLAEVDPKFFEKKKSPQEILDEEFGADFLQNGYDPMDAKRFGTKSRAYEQRLQELTEAEKRGGVDGDVIAQAVQAKVAQKEEGLKFAQTVYEEMKSKVPNFKDEIFEKYAQSVEPYSKNPVLANMFALKCLYERDFAVIEMAKKLIAEERLKATQKGGKLPTPVGSGGQPVSKHTKKKGDFEDIEESGLPSHMRYRK